MPRSAPDLLAVIRAAAAGLTAAELAAPVLVGVSGGPDSLALLHLLWRWSTDLGPPVRAIHVDHRLRPESGAEGPRVAAFCAARAIPVSLRQVEPGEIARARGGLEEGARRARYRLFAEEARRHRARVVALGHQADDQAETLLLHLLRGAGLAGLAAMPIIRRSGDLLDQPIAVPTDDATAARPALWRPLLGVPRAAIVDYCRTWALAPSHDPSNDDLTLRRNAVRHRVLPVLHEDFPEAAAILARNARILADDEEWLQGETARAWARCAEDAAGLVLLRRALFRAEHPAIQRRMVRRAWAGGRAMRAVFGLGAEPVELAREAIGAGRTGARLTLPDGVALLLEREEAAFGEGATIEAILRGRLGLPLVEPGWEVALGGPGLVELGDGWSVAVAQGEASGREVLHIPQGMTGMVGGVEPGLALRTWHDGDRLALPGTSGSQKVQDWFVDRRVPRYARRHLVVLAQGGRVLWILGLAAFPPAMPQAVANKTAGHALQLLYNGLPQPWGTRSAWPPARR